MRGRAAVRTVVGGVVGVGLVIALGACTTTEVGTGRAATPETSAEPAPGGATAGVGLDGTGGLGDSEALDGTDQQGGSEAPGTGGQGESDAPGRTAGAHRAVVPDKRAPPAPVLPTAVAAAVVPMFRSSVGEITPELAERMRASWRPGCPVPLENLRYVTVSHVDFDGVVRSGEVVVHAEVAEGLVGVFATLFELRYPIRSMRLVDDFGADDTDSMNADNTSAFNCRAITGGSAWSEHAYGKALDLNPVENPYVVGNHVAPRAGRDFVNRPDLPGVVHADDAVVRAFADAGWHWGGYWASPIDYQHFSVSGR